jgi:hypothetical protein
MRAIGGIERTGGSYAKREIIEDTFIVAPRRSRQTGARASIDMFMICSNIATDKPIRSRKCDE